jgi:hypothetical protein
MAILGMKPLQGAGEAIQKGVFTAEELLRYAMSLPVTTTITGMDKPDIVEQDLSIAQNFKPMTEEEMTALRTRGQQYADGRFEVYKVSLKYDNPEARLAHNYPIDREQKEVKEMLRATENSGKAWPSYK